MNMREEQGVAQVLAVISGKGGTGKTSLCAGIASCLAMDGLRVLCIDLDVGLRNLDIALGMQDVAVLPFTALMRGEYSLQQATQHPTLANLFLLTAPVTEDPETIDADAFGRLLDAARDAFDWILLDAPAGVGALFRMATRYADEAAVVALADPASQRDAARAAELLLQAHTAFSEGNWQVFAARMRELSACAGDLSDSAAQQYAALKQYLS